MHPHLLRPQNSVVYLEAISRSAHLVARGLTDATRPVAPSDPEHLRHLTDVDLDQPLGSLDEALAEAEQLWLDHAVWFHDPRYLAHLNCPVAVSALAADVLASAVNTSVDSYDQSTAGTFMERHLIAWTAERIGFSTAADGVFTSGGTQSNLQALLLARGRLAARLTGAEGLDAFPGELLPRLRILATSESHFSVRKAAGILGLGGRAVQCVDTDHLGRMRPAALAAALTDLAENGLLPMAVVATAGTTDRGTIDPLAELATVCAAEQVWLHVDAAVGGGLLTSRRHRNRLAGIEYADSVTVDYHKTWFQPVAASALIVADSRELRHGCVHADYLNPAPTGPIERPNQVDLSLQTTRRFDALKVWLTLRATGARQIGDWLDRCLEATATAWDSLTLHPDLEGFEQPQLLTLLFRYDPGHLPADAVDALNRRIRRDLFDSGVAVIAGTTLQGRHWLKFTILNPDTTDAEITEVLELVAGCGQELVAGASAGAYA
jgi:L-2,4-diaminobutyrate decarboxylase